METPKSYKRNLENKIITDEMLGKAIYSVNKRAKNCRDKAREYRRINRRNYFGDYYGYISKYNEKQIEYYSMKKELLEIVDPICIHVEKYPNRVRVYSNEVENYEELYLEKELAEEIVWTNYFYDEEKDERVFFFDYYDVENPNVFYYLYYQVSSFCFHSPIDSPEDYPDLEVVYLDDNIITEGMDIQDLLSLDFVKKILKLIRTNDFEYVKD